MTWTWEEERDLQGRVLDAVLRGDESPDATRLREIRAEILRDLRSDRDEGCGQIEAEVEREQQRLRAVEDGESGLDEPSAASTATLHLATLAIGERLRWLHRLRDWICESSTLRPEHVVESEVRWIDGRAAEIGHADRSLAGEAETLRSRARDLHHDVQRRSVRAWIQYECDEDEQAGEAEGGAEEEPGADVFRACWARVLDFHELASDLAISGYPDADHVRSLRESRDWRIATCRKAIESADEDDRGSIALEAVTVTESRVSSLLSEGDLLEPRDRVPKYRAGAAAVDDLSRVLDPPGRGVSSWFRHRSLGLSAFLRELRHLGWIRSYAERMARTSLVDARLERLLGRSLMRRLENLVFVLILLLVAIVVAEWRMDAAGTLTPEWALGFQIADLVLCLALLADFFLRWSCARWAPWFLRRHFLFDLLPALPYGFLLGPTWHVNWFLSVDVEIPVATYAHVLLLFRVFRLFRLVRGAVTGLRLFRLFVFVVRGMDRAVRRFRGLLDRDILLFEPCPPASETDDSLARTLARQEYRSGRLGRELFRETAWPERVALLHAHLALVEFELRSFPLAVSGRFEPKLHDRDLNIESLISKLTTCDGLTVEAMLSQREVERLAGMLRWCDLPLIRWLPLLNRWVGASRIPEPNEAVAEAARELGQFLERILALFHLGGDLSGITTAPQILDRIATALIKSTQRPAVRLIVIGGVTLLFSLFFKRVGFEALNHILEVLGVPFFILGSICLVINVIGRWFKRIAGEALDTYMRTSEAHFFHLVKEVKSRRFDDDLAQILERVLLPECHIRALSTEQSRAAFDYLREKLAVVRRSDDGPELVGGEDPVFEDFVYREVELVSLLYRDYLDGTLLERTSDKTSIQLLGNLAMRELRVGMLGLGKRELRRLDRLALEKDRLLGLGPYLWFRFISESLSIETAKLVMEYNSCCIPQRRLPYVSDELRQRHERFLERRRRRDAGASRSRRLPVDGSSMVTTEFHALHFLLAEEERDERIERIFGAEVRRMLVADRRAMVRDIFGTWPYHLLPRSTRRINPYRIYFKYLGGARVLLLPFVLAGRALGIVAHIVRRLIRIVGEVLGKASPVDERPRVAGFDVALRKINRMRKPYFMEAVRLRAAVDVEYLGLRPPGFEKLERTQTYREDLDFIGALERERRPFEDLRRAALRDLRALRVFLGGRRWIGPDGAAWDPSIDAAVEGSGREAEVMRAIAGAFVTDQHELRTAIVGPREIRVFFDEVLDRRPPGLLIRAWKLVYNECVDRWFAKSRRRRALFERHLRLHGRLQSASPRMLRYARNAFLDAPQSIERACEYALLLAESRDSYEAHVLDAFRQVAAEHALWSRRLITLRMIQSLTVLDVRAYRDLIWTLGGFGAVEEIEEREIVTSRTTEAQRTQRTHREAL